jgi:tetratricopeptide (TPR) repeat protein
LAPFIFEILLFFINLGANNNVSKNNFSKKIAIENFSQKKYNLALNNLKQTYQISKNEPEVVLLYGSALAKAGKAKEALNVLNSDVFEGNNKASFEAKNTIANIYLSQKDTTRSIQNFEKALTVNPKDKATRVNLTILKQKYRNKNQNKTSKKDSTLTKKQAIGQNTKEAKNKDFLDKLRQINLTEEQAKQIFDALGNEEKKYLRSKNTKNTTTDNKYSDW